MTELHPRTDRRDDPRRGAHSPAAAGGGLQTAQLRAAVLPAAVMAVLGIAVAGFLLAASASPTTATWVVLGVALALAVAVLAGAAYAAVTVSRQVHERVAALRALSSRGREELQQLAERVQRGERPAVREPEPLPAGEADPFSLLGNDLNWVQRVAEQAVLKAAGLASSSETDQRVEVFVNLAWRMQSLVHREIQLLDDLEAQVEDPELLKGLFTVDHLATRMRRQSESLAVLGGAVSRRQWTRPVTMHEVLRAAVAEVEQYSRVKVVPPVEGVLQGSAVADVIHLIAELVENATKFSAPQTQALLRAQAVTAGLAIEVEDRGLGMLAADRSRMNALLADPSLVNISELLRDGRIGLFVVSALARRHGIKVQLQSNIFGGTQAVVILPHTLIEGGRPDRLTRPEPQPQPAAAALPASSASLPGPQSGPQAGPQPSPQSGRQAPLPVRTRAVTRDPAPGLPGGGEYLSQHSPRETGPMTGPGEAGQPGAAAHAGRAGHASPASYPSPAGHAGAAGHPGGVSEDSGVWPRLPAAPGGRAEPGRAEPGGPGEGEPAAPAADWDSGTWPRLPSGTSGQVTPPAAASPAADPLGGAPRAAAPAASQDPAAWPPPSAPGGPSWPGGTPSPAADLPASSTPPPVPDGQADRPPLPRRQVQSHLAPQLRDMTTGRRDDPPADQMPDLMAAFRGGQRRAEEEDGEAGD